MKETVGILDTDVSYAEALCSRINEDGDFPYHARLFRDREDLAAYLQTASLPLLLLSMDMEDGALLRSDIGHLAFLSDVKGYTAVRGIPTLFKYRPVPDMKEDIVRHAAPADAAGKRGRVVTTGGRCAFVGVASPSGRVFKTGFALVLGMLLSQTARVLYVNCEPCSGFPALFEKDFGQDLGDLLYRYEAGIDDLFPEECLEEFHGLRILPPAGLPEDLCHADPAVLRDAVAAAAERLRMEITVVDLGPDLRFTEAFFPMLSKLYIPSLPNTAQEGKQAAFRGFLDRLQDDKGPVPEEEVELPVLRTFARGRVYLDQLLWSELGDEARRLLGGIL